MKIFILGCAKSGTTLLLRLFHAFENVTVLDLNYTELSLKEFIDMPQPQAGSVLVGKRSKGTLMSSELPEWLQLQQVEQIKQNNIQTIYVERPLYDVTKGGRVSSQRHRACRGQFLKYKHELDTIPVHYNLLLQKPDFMQAYLMSFTRLGLKAQKAPFSQYPNFVPEGRYYPEGSNYKLRDLEQVSPP